VQRSQSETRPRRSALIVDDDPSVREILKVILKRDGWNVETAGDGDDAIRLLGEKPYNVILLDLLMPRTNGEAVIEFIKSRSIRTPVVVVSAVVESVALDPQIVRVALQKPFEIRDLRDVLRALVAAGGAT